jgi:hypothetical protein
MASRWAQEVCQEALATRARPPADTDELIVFIRRGQHIASYSTALDAEQIGEAGPEQATAFNSKLSPIVAAMFEQIVLATQPRLVLDGFMSAPAPATHQTLKLIGTIDPEPDEECGA